jgi:hypothetical protein
MARLPDKPATPVDLNAVTYKGLTYEASRFAQTFKTGDTVADGALPSGATPAEAAAAAALETTAA